MDYWLIFQSLVRFVISWGGTVEDSMSVTVNVTAKQQSSVSRQIRKRVYLSCYGESVSQETGNIYEFFIPEKLRNEKRIKSYR